MRLTAMKSVQDDALCNTFNGPADIAEIVSVMGILDAKHNCVSNNPGNLCSFYLRICTKFCGTYVVDP